MITRILAIFVKGNPNSYRGYYNKFVVYDTAI